MFKAVAVISSVVLLSACVATTAPKEDAVAESSTPVATPAATPVAHAVGADAVTIMKDIPYKAGSTIALNIRQECSITRQLSEFTQSYGQKQGIEVVMVPNLDIKAKGRTLQMEITEAVSQGNAFIGHRKYTAIEGTLYDNGKKVSGFTAARVSGGGFFGAYKGSCSVLGRTVQTLGKDVAAWLKSPVDGAHLGDGV